MTSNRLGLLLPGFLIGAVLMMIVPVSPMFMDLFLAMNIALAVLVLLSVVTLKDSLDFSIFPALLLVMTLVRLSLNVSTTRLILLDGYAGKVVETFGAYVIGGSVIVGLVVFAILIVIQFAVVTNGAGRVAEVAARFTLDAMPGKQMAIDADLSAGLIDETQARQKRDRIATEADFYGAMDGASKFVKGDVIAGVLIVLINLFGGFAVGLSEGLSISESIDTYSRLTVGDGLVSQIPAILTSLAAGLLITRVSNDRDLGAELANQLFTVRRAMRLASYVLMAMALLPGLPKIPFLTLAASLWVLAGRVTAPAPEVETEPELRLSPDDPESLIGDMRVEPLELHLAYDVLDLVDPVQGGDLLDRVKALRRQVALDLGFVMPLVRTRDDVSLQAENYVIRLDGAEIGRGQAPKGRSLALPTGDGAELRALGGTPTLEPVFGLTAFWIPVEAEAQAAATGATVVDRSSVVVTHLAEIVRRHASRLITRQDVQMLVDGLRYDNPILARDIDDGVVGLGTLHSVLQALLDDGVSIRQLARIVEAIAQKAEATLEQRIAAARVALGPTIVASISTSNALTAVTFEPGFEASLHEGLREVDGEFRLILDPNTTEQLASDVRDAVQAHGDHSAPLIVLCGQALRRPLRRLLSALGLTVSVLAYPELPTYVEITTTGVIGRTSFAHTGPGADLAGSADGSADPR